MKKGEKTVLLTKITGLMEKVEAATELLKGNVEPALEYAEKHGIETKAPYEYKTVGSYSEDARYRYPARNKLAVKILQS